MALSQSATSTLSNKKVMTFEEKSDAFDEFTRIAKNNPAQAFTTTDLEGNVYPYVVQFNCDFGGEESKKVAMWRKQIRQIMRWHEESFHCNTCTENLHHLSIYAAKSGPTVFTDEQIGIFNGLPEANYTNRLLNKIVNLMKHHTSTVIPPFRLELCTDIQLRHGYAITNDGEEFEHHVGHTNSYLTYPLSNKQKEMKEAFTDLSDIMFQFLDKLTKLADIESLRNRCQVILKHLTEHSYGNKYSAAVNWIISTCNDYQAAGQPILPWDRIEIVAKMICHSHLGLNSDRKRISFHLQQANGAILNWLENAHNENALKGLIRETLNPKNYQQRKPAAVETWGAGGKGSTAGQIAKVRKLLGDFSVKFATVESLQRNRPSSTFVVPTSDYDSTVLTSDAYAALTNAAKNAKNRKSNHSLAAWESNPYSDFNKITSIQELARNLKNIKPGDRLEFRYSANEPMVMYEFTKTHSDAWKIQSEDCDGDAATRGFSWSFLGNNSPHITLRTMKWGALQAIHFAGPERCVLVLQEPSRYSTPYSISTIEMAEKIRDEFNNSPSEKGRRQGFGAWALSSIAHSFGQTVLSLMPSVWMQPYYDGETPIIGPGFCRSSKKDHEGEFSFEKDIQFRIMRRNNKVWPFGEYHSIRRFDSPPAKISPPKTATSTGASNDWVEKLRSLKSLYDEGIITRFDFENKKASILTNN